MELELLDLEFHICKCGHMADIPSEGGFLFVGKTDNEISLVCPKEITPKNCICVERGFRGLRIKGTLDFSLIGILADISRILAEEKIGIFVISTYDTDYIFVKEHHLEKAITALKECGYLFLS